MRYGNLVQIPEIPNGVFPWNEVGLQEHDGQAEAAGILPWSKAVG